MTQQLLINSGRSRLCSACPDSRRKSRVIAGLLRIFATRKLAMLSARYEFMNRSRLLKSENYLIPDWPAPENVRALTTTRLDGVSPAPFNSFNLADHVGDSPECVTANRVLLVEQLNLPAEPYWLTQVHGSRVVYARSDTVLTEADASFARETGVVCAVLTADCLPVLFCDAAGQSVAAAHAGWRGLAAGVLEESLASMVVPATAGYGLVGACYRSNCVRSRRRCTVSLSGAGC